MQKNRPPHLRTQIAAPCGGAFFSEDAVGLSFLFLLGIQGG